MERKRALIEQVKANFDIRELVCPHTYERWGNELSWQFLQADLLEVIYVLRSRLLKVPMIVNTWASGGQFDERGLRIDEKGIGVDVGWCGELYFIVPLWV